MSRERYRKDGSETYAVTRANEPESEVVSSAITGHYRPGRFVTEFEHRAFGMVHRLDFGVVLATGKAKSDQMRSETCRKISGVQQN